MMLSATKKGVFNRGIPPDSFILELVEWEKNAPEDLFAPNKNYDIYNKVYSELGPWENLLHRRAVMLEVLRVLAGFESSWDWDEGVDVSRAGETTNENAEAGAWQVSYDSRKLDPSLSAMLKSRNIEDGIHFQRSIKLYHGFATEYETTLLRIDVKNPERLHNGPLYKGEERRFIRKSLRGPEHSIYPWLSRSAVQEFLTLIT